LALNSPIMMVPIWVIASKSTAARKRGVNRLYFGDNLEWLRDRSEFPEASVDFVYLDPPFNSNASHYYS